MIDTPSRISAALADRYRIERELGKGGMATVYLAEDIKHKRKVALKVLKPELAAVLGAERFVQEITTTAALQHPHILPLFDSGTADGFLYYVMPFIDGETLRAKLDRETQLGIDEAVKIATNVANALDYAHRHGVIHRDIKPENILLHEGRPMVADFGIALAVSAAAGGRMTETGLSLGTPHYMSPEQATAEKEITARSDVYSLASVLYEMLAGQPPHLGGSAQQIIMKIIAEPVQPVTRFRKTVPPNVAAALAKALEKLPADRFASAAGFGDALRNAAFRLGAAESVSLGGAAGARSPLVVLLAATAVVAAGLAAWGWMRPQQVPPLRHYSMLMVGEDAVSGAAPVMGSRLALSPDGSKLVYSAGDESVGGPALYMRDLTTLKSVRLAGTDAGRRPFFAPDGDRIAFLGPDGSINIVGATGEPARKLSGSDFSDTRGGDWGSDGYIYGAERGDGGPIIRIPENGGPFERVTTLDTAAGERIHQYPSFLPNGRGLVFAVRGSDVNAGPRIAVVELPSGKHRTLLAGWAAWYSPSGHLLVVMESGALMAVPFDQDRMEVTGAARQVLDGVGVTRLGAELTLSASGTLMYMSGSAGYAVQPVWMDARGQAAPIDPAWTFVTTSIYSTMAISPDGSRLVVSEGSTTGQQLHVKQLPTGPKQQLTFEGKVNSRATWSRDGRTIMYISDRTGTNMIWQRIADGSAPAEQLFDLPANDGYRNPDGSWIIFRGIGGDRHVYARRSRGDTAVLAVARSPRGEDLAPALSPDGKWIAYASTESGRGEVYLKPFPEVNRSKKLVSIAGGMEPRWSHDGLALYYRNDANELVAIGVSARGDSVVLGERRTLFSMKEFLPPNIYQSTYDVVPVGQRFVMGRRLDTSAGEQLIVVEHFVQHLEELIRP